MRARLFPTALTCLALGACSGGNTNGTTGTFQSVAASTTTTGGNGAATSGSGGTTGSGTTNGTTSGFAGCGGASEPCCAQSICDGSLSCVSNTCTQVQTGAAGTPCSKNGDCPSGICIPVGEPVGQDGWTGNVCSTTCGSTSDCVAGWSCSPLLGQTSNVCQCQYSPEVCDGLDNDCNGIVDDEPAVDLDCVSREGQGAVCEAGQCACGSGVTACGATCVDTQTDPNDCGACGAQCSAPLTNCVGGSCACPSGEDFCGAS